MGSMWRAKNTIYLVLAGIFLIVFALGIVIGVSYAFGYPRYDPGFLPVIAGLCVPTALVPGIVFLFLGRRARERRKGTSSNSEPGSVRTGGLGWLTSPGNSGRRPSRPRKS